MRAERHPGLPVAAPVDLLGEFFHGGSCVAGERCLTAFLLQKKPMPDSRGEFGDPGVSRKDMIPVFAVASCEGDELFKPLERLCA